MLFRALILLVMSSTALAGECKFSAAPQVIQPQPHDDPMYVWEQTDDPALYEDADVAKFPLISQLQAHVAKYVTTNQIELLKRQRQHFARMGEDGAKRHDKIINGEVGEIVAMRCLEALMYETHLQHQAPVYRTTEFNAMILSRGDQRRFYVVVGSDTNGSAPGIPEAIFAATKDGWQLDTHLHSHPFFLSNLPKGDVAGTTIPSGNARYGDLESYIRWRDTYKLKAAVITNGFNSYLLDVRESESLL